MKSPVITLKEDLDLNFILSSQSIVSTLKEQSSLKFFLDNCEIVSLYLEIDMDVTDVVLNIEVRPRLNPDVSLYFRILSSQDLGLSILQSLIYKDKKNKKHRIFGKNWIAYLTPNKYILLDKFLSNEFIDTLVQLSTTPDLFIPRELKLL